MSTIKDIAAEAGVSVMTVSNVINNNHSRVSPGTEKRVREIMAKHNYVPSMVARSLISKSSRIIAVLLPIWYASSASMLRDPYAGQLVGHIEELLREKEYYVMVCSFEQVSQVLKIQQTWHIDGMIQIMPHEDAVTRELIQQSRTPLVICDRHFDDLQMLSVCLDDHKGGYLATKYLLEQGHRDIGFAAPAVFESAVIHARYMGYLDALHEYALKENSDWVFNGTIHQEGGEEVARRICSMQKRPTAMLATEDLIACGIIKGCQECGLSIPQDLSVIGFDDSMPSRLITPALTTVAQDVHAKAKTAVDMLMHAISDPDFRNQHTVLDVSLVTRQSVHSL